MHWNVVVWFLLFALVYSQDDPDCDKYLRKYGYLKETVNRTEALKAFQRVAHLERTGQCDTATKDKMSKPRCGCLDIMHYREVPGFEPGRNARRTQNFRALARWRRTTLTWKLETPLRNGRITVEDQRDAFKRAFQLWADQTPLRFQEITNNADADINIVFAGDHSIGPGDEGFDGPGSVLAHAFFPEDGRAHFDEEERWVINSDDGIELFIVAAHEFGHNLGLGHSEVQSALMAPFYSGFTEDFRLDSDDIAGIRTLYGGPPTATPPPPTTRRSTLRPTQPTLRPTTGTRSDICDVPFSAIMSVYTGDLFAFIGFRSLLMIRPGLGIVYGPANSGQVFERSPRRPGAAFSILTTGEYFITKGLRNFRFDAGGNRDGRPDWILGGIDATPERPRAAMAISRNEIYMFGASQVWRWDAYDDQVISGSHRSITEEFPGVPQMLNAALAFNESLAYFFKGTRFITYDLENRRVITGFRDTGSFFMPRNCGNPN